ncbi:hypothetical protein COL01_05795 [Bacillus thuringiensis]|uniref:Uncharacterized protein n=1 Tax=Bacillus thuringiensis TaxID=1428 RepID=A0A9X6ZR88_BACTU|nr:hypothetical protein COJ15_27505 [Bacillus thuringiensis]PFN53289.1 hypothetical protein COJ75_22970 [Bacillus thuringiensis]PFV36479.1 hypothetical protein COL01_05795 [Bacillus thuringiensis]
MIIYTRFSRDSFFPQKTGLRTWENKVELHFNEIPRMYLLGISLVRFLPLLFLVICGGVNVLNTLLNFFNSLWKS